MIAGPCVICDRIDYPLSMGGPTICPQCDCGNWDPQQLLRQLAAVRAELAVYRAAPSPSLGEPIQQAGPGVRYIYACEVTGAQREQAKSSALYQHGDMRLVWVNEGDLYRHWFDQASPTAAPNLAQEQKPVVIEPVKLEPFDNYNPGFPYLLPNAMTEVRRALETIMQLHSKKEVHLGHPRESGIGECIYCTAYFALEHLASPLPASGEGWVRVPREPTEEMLIAADAIDLPGYPGFKEILTEEWRAMVAAAPKVTE